MRTFTLDNVATALSSIVQQFGPGHVAQGPDGSTGCTYAVSDQNRFLTPVCIIGQYIAALGFLGVLIENDGYDEPDFYGACMPDSTMWDALRSAGLDFEPEARGFLRIAQATQDGGDDWGTALHRAYVEFASNPNLGFEARRAIEQAIGNHKVPVTITYSL